MKKEELTNPDSKSRNNISESFLKRGTTLLSTPLLNDPNFKRTAVLILDEDASGGHLGLILNRPLDLTLKEICEMPGKEGSSIIHNGGPVDMQRLFWLHSLGNLLPDSIEILPGLYVGGDYDSLIRLSESDFPGTDNNIKFYLGYSGWSRGQLKEEIEEGVWGLLPMVPDSNLILRLDGEELWHQLLLLLGPDYRHWRMIPADPNLN